MYTNVRIIGRKCPGDSSQWSYDITSPAVGGIEFLFRSDAQKVDVNKAGHSLFISFTDSSYLFKGLSITCRIPDNILSVLAVSFPFSIFLQKNLHFFYLKVFTVALYASLALFKDFQSESNLILAAFTCTLLHLHLSFSRFSLHQDAENFPSTLFSGQYLRRQSAARC